LLVVYYVNINRAGILQAGSKEMHDLRSAVFKGDSPLTKVMLAEFTWQSLESDHWRLSFMGTDAANQIVDGCFATFIAEGFQASENFLTGRRKRL